MTQASALPGLVKLSDEELQLVRAFRSCCHHHRQGLLWFANASASNCSTHSTHNLVVIAPKVTI